MTEVMNHRATMAGRVELGDSLDYFPSAPWWGRALGETLDRLGLPGRASVEEPAAGEGHLAHGLAEVFDQVRASDVHAYRPRDVAENVLRAPEPRDYLAASVWQGTPPSRRSPDWCNRPDWVATNPPFGDRTAAFIRRGVARARIGAAFLLQLRLMEGKGRHHLFRECGLYAVAVLPRKGSGLRKGLWQPGLSTATTYAWFIFANPQFLEGWDGFDGEARTVWVDPDASGRLTRDSDMAFSGLAMPGRAA